jgi:centriolar protein POC1
MVVTCSDDKTIKGWSVKKKNFMFALPGHSNWVRSCKLSPDSRLVVSGSDDCSVRVWDVAESRELYKWRTPLLVNSVDWVSEGTSVCAGGADGSVDIWDVRSNRLV